MAIYSSVPPPSQQHPPPQPAPSSNTPLIAPSTAIEPIDIEQWTASTTVTATAAALQNLSVSRGTGVTLSIPLDDEIEKRKDGKRGASTKEGVAKVKRDSMKRREALLKGNEGSRRRQRWENDNLLHNPHIQPPLPSDWAPSATHRVRHIPYYLAPLWDAGIAHRVSERNSNRSSKASSSSHGSANGVGAGERGRVPTDLKLKLKKAKGAKTLLQELELEIRAFVEGFERAQAAKHTSKSRISSPNKPHHTKSKDSKDDFVLLASDSNSDSEDEIVFIGRDKDGKGITMSDRDYKEVKDVVEEELRREKIVYEGLEGSKEGGFARWLVHGLAGYYGLASWSETVEETGKGRTGKRVAWVGFRGEDGMNGIGGGMEMGEGLPRPLWGMV